MSRLELFVDGKKIKWIDTLKNITFLDDDMYEDDFLDALALSNKYINEQMTKLKQEADAVQMLYNTTKTPKTKIVEKTVVKEGTYTEEQYNRLKKDRDTLVELYRDSNNNAQDLLEENNLLKLETKQFNPNALPLKAPLRLDLTEYFTMTKEKEKHAPCLSWSAQDQIEAFKFYADEDVHILCHNEPDDYQGSVEVLFTINGFIFLYRTSFGSCSGCDWLDGLDLWEGYEAFKRTISEGNTLQFWSKKHALTYLLEIRQTKDRWNYFHSFPIGWLEDYETQEEASVWEKIINLIGV